MANYSQVAHHHALALPALKAGKSVFIEWPLAVNSTEAEELASLARSHDATTVVGVSPYGVEQKTIG